LLPEDALPLTPGEEGKWNAKLRARREQLRRHEDAGEFEAAVRMHHHDHWARALSNTPTGWNRTSTGV
jgi:hypothetical protein